MSSAICFNLDQSKILSSGSGLTCYQNQTNKKPKDLICVQIKVYIEDQISVAEKL